MNKTIFYRKLWVHHVIRFTLFILVFSSFVFLPNSDEDYILLNKVFERIKNKNPDRLIILKESNDNEYVISVVNQLNSYEKNKNKFKLDSLKNEIGVRDNIKFNSIFNLKEYSYLISQKSNTKWDLNKIIGNKNSVTSKSQVNLYVSKPIYTKKSNFALVYINNEKNSYIVIYEKIKNNWREYKIILPLLITSKVSVKNE